MCPLCLRFDVCCPLLALRRLLPFKAIPIKMTPVVAVVSLRQKYIDYLTILILDVSITILFSPILPSIIFYFHHKLSETKRLKLHRHFPWIGKVSLYYEPQWSAGQLVPNFCAQQCVDGSVGECTKPFFFFIEKLKPILNTQMDSMLTKLFLEFVLALFFLAFI